MGRRTIGEMRLETQLLIERLRTAKDGETITYSDLSKAAGVDVQNGARGLLMTATKTAERELGSRFQTVRGVGIKRLLPDAWGGALSSDRDGVRRKAQRALNRSMSLNYERMTAEQRAEVDGNRTVLHFVSRATTDRQVAKLTAAAAETGKAIGFDSTLKHFASK